MRHPKVSIIVLNWNGLEDTVECLESLKMTTYPNYNVIVVDNGSKGDDVKVLQERFGGYIQLIPKDRNHGFAEGNNIGIRYALSELYPDYLLLLNNDVVVDPGFLTALVEVAEGDASVGIAGPKIYSYAKPDRIQSAGGRINWWLGKASLIGVGQIDEGQFDQLRQVDYVIGCALLIRLRTMEEIGLLYPGYFAYFEETEWCARCKKAGHKVVYVPSAKIWHKLGATSRRIDGFRLYYMTRNRILFNRRNSTKSRFALSTLYFVTWVSLRTGGRIVLRQKEPRLLRKLCGGILDGILSRTGAMSP